MQERCATEPEPRAASWGRHGHEPGQFDFGSSQDYTKPPGGGIAVAGNYVYVADSGNNRIQRFNLSGGEQMEWGSKGSGPAQFRYPRGLAANAAEVLVADDDNHRIEKFDPDGGYQGSAGSQGQGPGQFGFPYGIALDSQNAYVTLEGNQSTIRIAKTGGSPGFIGLTENGPHGVAVLAKVKRAVASVRSDGGVFGNSAASLKPLMWVR